MAKNKSKKYLMLLLINHLLQMHKIKMKYQIKHFVKLLKKKLIELIKKRVLFKKKVANIVSLFTRVATIATLFRCVSCMVLS